MPKPRVSTVVQREDPDTPVTVLLEEAAAPEQRQRCMHPDCPRMCKWATGGRPGAFCRSECRRNFEASRRALHNDIESLTALLQRDLSYAERRALLHAIGLRRWALARYPELAQTAAPKASG